MQSQKILIVEDDLFLRELYTDILSSESWIVDTAADGQEGLEKIKAGGWNLVLLDINLPKLNGIDIIKSLKTEPSLAANHIIVFLTNMEEGPVLKEIQTMGYKYLIKSQLSPDQFLQQIKSHLTSINKV